MAVLDREPDYIVLRFDPALTEADRHGRSSAYRALDGVWFDRSRFGTAPDINGHRWLGGAVARPVGEFEVREDGAVAEVWLVTAQ